MKCIPVLGLLIGTACYSYSPVLLARWSRGPTDFTLTPVEVWMSEDGGVSWTLRGIPDSVWSNCDMGLGLGASPSRNLYLVALSRNQNADPFDGARFYFSSDTGRTWEHRGDIAPDGIVDRNSSGIAVLRDDLIYAYLLGASSSGLIEIYKSVNGGSAWDSVCTIPVPATSIAEDPEGEMCFDSENRLYIAEWACDTSFPCCYRSTDGIAWSLVDTISSDISTRLSRSTAITSTGECLYATTWSNSCDLKLYESTDHGDNWDYVTTVLGSSSQLDGSQSIGASSDSSLYIAAWDRGNSTLLFRSDDKGRTWSQTGTISPIAHQHTCALSFAPLEPASIGCNEPGPASFVRGPLRCTVAERGHHVFRYYLPALGFVDLRIYDMSGRLVDVLVSETQEKGEHHAEWKSNMNRGIYFYRLEIRKSITTGKLLAL
jgi:hypothetical protein